MKLLWVLFGVAAVGSMSCASTRSPVVNGRAVTGPDTTQNVLLCKNEIRHGSDTDTIGVNGGRLKGFGHEFRAQRGAYESTQVTRLHGVSGPFVAVRIEREGSDGLAIPGDLVEVRLSLRNCRNPANNPNWAIWRTEQAPQHGSPIIGQRLRTRWEGNVLVANVPRTSFFIVAD